VDVAGVPIRGSSWPASGHTERANPALGVIVRKVFVSYARANRPHVEQLVEHLGVLDCQTWFDSSLRGGQDWWEQILDRITDCDVFIAIISREALNSVACEREFDWAEALGKPVLPVALQPPSQALPQRFSRRQIVDYSNSANRDRAALILAGGLNALPGAPALPEPLPEPPSAPLSYLTELVDRVSTPGFLDHDQQRQIIFQLEAAVRSVDPEERRGGRDILERFSSRDDLYADVDRMITWLKGSAEPETDAKTVVAQGAATTAAQTEPATETEPQPERPAPAGNRTLITPPVRQTTPSVRPPPATEGGVSTSAPTHQRSPGRPPVPPPRPAVRPPPDTRTPPRQPWWRRKVNRRTAIAVLAGPVVVCVAAVVFAGATLRLYLADRAVADAQHAIVQTATNAITTLWTYTPENVDTLADRASQYLSGDFEAQYRKYVDAIVAPNKQAQVTNTAQVVGAGVESLSGPEASAVIYVNTTSTTPQTRDKPSTKYLSYRLTMHKHDSRWLITKMTTITAMDFVPKSPVPG
jgi:hypothetical protein